MNIELGKITVGNGFPCYIIAEIGINHNGSLEIAKKLIDVAAVAGCQAVKFQKRTVEVVYSEEELDKPRLSPFGSTNGDLKRGLELSYNDYEEINRYCKTRGIEWFASSWDVASVDFIEQFNPICHKIASAVITDHELLRHHCRFSRPLVVSTGMSDERIIDATMDICRDKNVVLLHCTSTYPSRPEDLNLKAISTLRERYKKIPIGYSGHELGLSTSIAAVALGACVIERHITLDRHSWGSDHSASVEPQGLIRLVRDIRTFEKALGDGELKIMDSELPVIKKLRKKV